MLQTYPRLDAAALDEALAFYQDNREEIDRSIEENESIALGAE